MATVPTPTSEFRKNEKTYWFHLGYPKPADQVQPCTSEQGKEIEAACAKNECAKFLKDYDGCVERLPRYNNPHVNCFEWYVWLHDCVDKCAKPKIWATLR
eukprot:TRINITY_DN69734_c0_g1_i1.p4 TRINITY_DN69734_c0_g1~~TRINITY_DN69734_c0_g1_i1.p4  ORF type:complete len:100 (+),score=6.58 TRINITY_DN69734_c0_g1_i1:108-407(+)